MLERIHIRNYKCLRDVEVQLGDFTVLIGPNDSGKTSFLDAIHSLGLIATKPLGKVFGGDRSLANLVWRKEKARNVIWEVAGQVAQDAFTYFLELPPGPGFPTERIAYQGHDLFQTEEDRGGLVVRGQFPEQMQFRLQPGMTPLSTFARNHHQPFQAIIEELSASVEYRFDPKKLCAPSVPELEPILHPSGENLASVLEALRNDPDRSGFNALERDLQKAIPTLQGITLPPVRNSHQTTAHERLRTISKRVPPLSSVRNSQGAKALEFILSGNGKPPVTIPASLASSGALLMTAFLALAHGRSPGMLLIEEPENGLHPSRLEMVINLLRQISQGHVGNRKRQVIVTTHSPLLLNYVKPEEVRVFVRDPEQGTKVTPMTEVPDIDNLLKEFATGELWYLLGEEKLFEGQPA